MLYQAYEIFAVVLAANSVRNLSHRVTKTKLTIPAGGGKDRLNPFLFYFM